MRIPKITLSFACISAIIGISSFMTGCTENIGDEDRYVQKENTITSYLSKHEDFTEYYEILGHVRISSNPNSSTLKQLLSARGHYTVFAPTNEAIYAYLDSLAKREVILSPDWDGFRDEAQLDSVRKVIAYNSIIDGGDLDYSGNAVMYNTPELPTEDNEELQLANLADRKMIVNYGKNGTMDSIYINKIPMNRTNRDIPTLNGYIHQMDGVIAPGYEALSELLHDWIAKSTHGYLVMAKMVEACGFMEELSMVRDEKYEQNYRNGIITDLRTHPTEGSTGYVPQHRYYGFTIFAEPDEFWEERIGKEAKDITLEDVMSYLQTQGVCPSAKVNNRYSSPDNLLYQFISYHILNVRIPRDKLVVHYNERGNDPKTGNLGVAMYELYTTMGQRRLLKIFESAESKGVYLNRFPVLDNSRHGTYHETYCAPDKMGVYVDRDNCNTSTQNGIIYPISSMLWYSDEVRDNLGKQRLRWDVSSMFREFMNNGIRGNTVTLARNMTVGIPSDESYVKYFEDLDILPGSEFYYLMGRDKGWPNYLGDEFNVIGRYELVMKLPPVPRKGVYELRIANSCGVNYRSMCQVYFGTDKNSLPAAGTPLDFRMNGLYRMTDAGNLPSIVGWVADDPEDDEFNAKIDKQMRNNGFMKGLQLYCGGRPGGSTMGRAVYYLTRRIMLTETMDPDKTYYMRLKNVLDDSNKQLYMDFIELCPKEVYDNPHEPEDIW